MPVPKLHEKPDGSKVGPIENKTLDDVRKEPFKLLKQFVWDEIDITDDE